MFYTDKPTKNITAITNWKMTIWTVNVIYRIEYKETKKPTTTKKPTNQQTNQFSVYKKNWFAFLCILDKQIKRIQVKVKF